MEVEDHRFQAPAELHANVLALSRVYVCESLPLACELKKYLIYTLNIVHIEDLILLRQ